MCLPELHCLLSHGCTSDVFSFRRESDALRLEEHEQFNRKIVASAPVGICILRTADGVNILSNELAHTYLNMLTHEDRQRLMQM